MKKALLKIGVAVSPFLFLLGSIVGKVQAEPYGWSPNVDNSWGGTPTCTDAKPDKAPILLQPNHPSLPQPKESGAIRLQWIKVPGATGYNVYYGLSPKNYIFTARDLPDTDNFTVSHLGSRTYYFAVQAIKGCAASSLSNEWAARPGGTGFVSTTALGFVPVQRRATSAVSGVTSYTPPEPTAAAEVQGVTAEPIQGTAYEAPTQPQYIPPVAPVAPKPTPKPNLWQLILRFFGLAK